MKDSTHLDYVYRHICSCCGKHVTKQDRELPDNNESEGNLCGRCYGEQQLQAWFEMKEIFDKVSNALNPINKLKFNYESDAYKWYLVQKMFKKGIIKYTIT